MTMTAMFWPSICSVCDFEGRVYGWSNAMPLSCPECGEVTRLVADDRNESHGIITDNFPGGLMVRHAICHEDGSPKRYDSKTDMKKALNKAGYSIHGDTPRPYRV